MNINDIRHIFQKEIDVGTTSLYFMLVDGNYRVVERHPTHEIANLIPLLECFQYAGYTNSMPTFIK